MQIVLDWNRGAAFEQIEQVPVSEPDRRILRAISAVCWPESMKQSREQALTTLGHLQQTTGLSLYALRQGLKRLHQKSFITSQADPSCRGFIVSVDKFAVWGLKGEKPKREPSGADTSSADRTAAAVERLAAAVEVLAGLLARALSGQTPSNPFEPLRTPSKGSPHDMNDDVQEEKPKAFPRKPSVSEVPDHHPTSSCMEGTPSKTSNPSEPLRRGLGVTIDVVKLGNARYCEDLFQQLERRGFVADADYEAFFACCAWLEHERQSSREARVKSPGGWLNRHVTDGDWQSEFDVDRWRPKGVALINRLNTPPPAPAPPIQTQTGEGKNRFAEILRAKGRAHQVLE